MKLKLFALILEKKNADLNILHLEYGQEITNITSQCRYFCQLNTDVIKRAN